MTGGGHTCREHRATCSDVRSPRVTTQRLRNSKSGPPGVAQSVPASAQATISRFVGSSPASGSVLTAGSLDPSCFGFCVSLPLCPSPARALSLFPSKMNAH